MNIVYLVFGDNLDNYQQVYFSIYTAFVHKTDDDKIIVVVENASLFQSFGDKIEVIEVTKEQIKEWISIHEYLFRIKIKALQLVAFKYPTEHLLFLDGDTFIGQNLSFLKKGMDEGKNFMHLNEGKLSGLTDKSQKRMWKTLKDKTFCDIKIDVNTCMWNSGVIGISSENLNALDLCLKLNDQMIETGVVRRVIEQFAFSIALSTGNELKSSDHIVGHYWGNKEQWNLIISNFLKECFMKDYSFEQIISKIQEMDLRQYPVWVRRSNTQRRLKNFIDSFYKDLRPEYVK